MYLISSQPAAMPSWHACTLIFSIAVGTSNPQRCSLPPHFIGPQRRTWCFRNPGPRASTSSGQSEPSRGLGRPEASARHASPLSHLGFWHLLNLNFGTGRLDGCAPLLWEKQKTVGRRMYWRSPACDLASWEMCMESI